MKNVLIIDVGTQSMRGIIFDSGGNLLVKEQLKYPPYVSVANGHVEQDVDMYWQSLCKITSAIAEKRPDLMNSVVAMSVDVFRDSIVFLDEDCKPLRKAIIWTDQREADTSKKLPFKQRALLRLVGMTRTIEAIRKKVRTSWVKQNEPDVWAKTHKVVHVSAYLTYKLTGNLADTPSASVGHLPFDSKNRRWYKKGDLLFPVFDCPTEKMCALVEPGETFGTISETVAAQTGIPQGLKVIASGSDKGCETLGVGCFDENVASVSFGTSASVQFSTKRYFEPEPLMPSYPAAIKDYYNPEVQIFHGYWMVSWFKSNFARELEQEAAAKGIAVEEILNEEMTKINPGCDGLVLQPFWQGGLTTPEARGAIIGFSNYHTRAHVYRSIIEGIDFALREGMERMERRGKQRIDYVSVSGGGSQSDVICQIAADVFNKPVKRVQTYETSGLGAAIISFTACGVFDNVHDAVENMVHFRQKVFTPNPENVKVYDDMYKNIYSKMYSSLRKYYFYLEK